MARSVTHPTCGVATNLCGSDGRVRRRMGAVAVPVAGGRSFCDVPGRARYQSWCRLGLECSWPNGFGCLRRGAICMIAVVGDGMALVATMRVVTGEITATGIARLGIDVRMARQFRPAVVRRVVVEVAIVGGVGFA